MRIMHQTRDVKMRHLWFALLVFVMSIVVVLVMKWLFY